MNDFGILLNAKVILNTGSSFKKSWYLSMKSVCEFSFIHAIAEISQRLISESNLCIRTEFSQGSLLRRAQMTLISFLHKSLSEVTTYILLVKTSVLRQISSTSSIKAHQRP